jgi:hypothetical protein
VTSEEILRAAGASCVGGDLILKHKTVGQYRNGDFQLTAEGLLLIEDLRQQKDDEIRAVVAELAAEPASEEKPKNRGGRPRKVQP